MPVVRLFGPGRGIRGGQLAGARHQAGPPALGQMLQSVAGGNDGGFVGIGINIQP